jgi:hypothetical protein
MLSFIYPRTLLLLKVPPTSSRRIRHAAIANASISGGAFIATVSTKLDSTSSKLGIT